MRPLTFSIILVLFALPAFTQTTFSLVGTSQHNGDGGEIPSTSRNLRAEFDDGAGFGFIFGLHLGRRFSGELALFKTSSDASLVENGTPIASLGDVDADLASAMLRFHFLPPGTVDLWAGAGGAHVSFDDLESNDMREQGVGPIRVDSETVVVVGAGAAYQLSERVGILVDVRWLPLTLTANVAGERVEADLDPLLASAGVRFRF